MIGFMESLPQTRGRNGLRYASTADDIVTQILQAIQAKLADLDRKVSDQGRTLNIVKQDVRMIRSTIHDMARPV
jgi:hypothetical protein